MSKLTTNDKIQIYEKKQNGETISKLCADYDLDRSTVKYMLAVIKKHGFGILDKKRAIRYSEKTKKKAVKRVNNGESIKSVAIDLGLSSGTTLRKWILKYRK